MADVPEHFYFPFVQAVVTLLPGLIGIIASTGSSKEDQDAKKSWKIAFYATLVSIVITSVYHLPTNLAFINQSYDAAQATSKLQLWVALHWVRIALALIVFRYVGAIKQREW